MSHAVEVAAVRLMLKYPFWCELYYSMKIIETHAVPTLATDGKRMWVNPEFFAGLALDYKITALAHEVCHKMLHHCTRGRGHKMPWSNIAMDIIVNTMLHDNGFKIHPRWVQPEAKYRGWTYEAIYDDLIKNLPKPPPQPDKGQAPPEEDEEQGEGTDEGDEGEEQEGEDGDEEGEGGEGSPEEEGEDGEGEGAGDQEGEGEGDEEGDEGAGASVAGEMDPNVPDKYKDAWLDVRPFQGTPEQAEAFEEKVEEQVQEALQRAKAEGHAPAGVEMAMEKVTKIAEEQWFDHLHRFFQKLRLATYDWATINKRLAMRYRVIAPTQYTPQLGTVVVFRDASGSCFYAAQQAQWNTHVNAILSEAKPEKIIVADFDTVVHRFSEVQPGDIDFDEPPTGGGGTSFTELIPWMEEQGIVPDVVIILTDMYGTFPTEEPPYPVIWASTSPGMHGPFGDTIFIN